MSSLTLRGAFYRPITKRAIKSIFLLQRNSGFFRHHIFARELHWISFMQEGEAPRKIAFLKTLKNLVFGSPWLILHFTVTECFQLHRVTSLCSRGRNSQRQTAEWAMYLCILTPDFWARHVHGAYRSLIRSHPYLVWVGSQLRPTRTKRYRILRPSACKNGATCQRWWCASVCWYKYKIASQYHWRVAGIAKRCDFASDSICEVRSPRRILQDSTFLRKCHVADLFFGWALWDSNWNYDHSTSIGSPVKAYGLLFPILRRVGRINDLRSLSTASRGSACYVICIEPGSKSPYALFLIFAH